MSTCSLQNLAKTRSPAVRNAFLRCAVHFRKGARLFTFSRARQQHYLATANRVLRTKKQPRNTSRLNNTNTPHTTTTATTTITVIVFRSTSYQTLNVATLGVIFFVGVSLALEEL